MTKSRLPFVFHKPPLTVKLYANSCNHAFLQLGLIATSMSALCYVTYRPHHPTLTLSSTTSTRRVAQRHHAIRRADASCLVISSTLIFEEFVPVLLTENGDIFGVLVLPFLTESDADMVGVRWSLVNFIVSS
ncbi:hypothetical protein ARMSODRAFT_604489 [Armillaria solidipes]|uniref:Uncharacterized protein n=1 Tax=Armillaria solidipes TaxID=1076256 RepID=A0A2H3BEX9_9AGAR|nr:hypothetical protein ARMSODRAFT_604489 [Armillaria solidipes]